MDWPFGILGTIGVALAAAVLLLNALFVIKLVIAASVLQYNNPAFRDHAKILADLPYPLYWNECMLHRLANKLTWMKPAPLRVAQVAVAYMQSQALFVLVNLGVPETLQTGPKTAQQLAEAAGPNTNAEWLARVLKMAAELGLVNRTRRPGLKPAGTSQPHVTQNGTAGAMNGTAGAVNGTAMNGAGKDLQQQHDQGSKLGREPFACGYHCNDIYTANAMTSILCKGHPNSMADFVGLFEDHYAGFVHMSEGIKNNVTPFEIWSGGKDYWQHLRDDPRYAATFDGAMRACNHTGAKMAVEQYPWNRYDVVVDVGGGNGQFLMELLTKHRKLHGVLVDQKEQIQRGKEWWNDKYQHLLPRMEFVAADMFDPASLPTSQPGVKTLYVLKQILHDWSDTDSLAILRSIRAVFTDEDVATGRASLAVLETGTMESINRPILQHRLEADMTMLMSFGDGKERDEEQTEVLLAAAGFKVGRLVPTTGVMAIFEATPVPAAAGSKRKQL